MKARPLDFANSLAGKQLVLIFEKPSLRTRLTFEVGMAALGGNSFFLDQREDGIGRREPICDIARNLERRNSRTGNRSAAADHRTGSPHNQDWRIRGAIRDKYR